MKDWADKGELVALVAQARREARDHGPRQSNDELEAAMFIAMALALSKYFADQEQRSQPEDKPAEEKPVGTEAVLDEAEYPGEEEADVDADTTG